VCLIPAATVGSRREVAKGSSLWKELTHPQWAAALASSTWSFNTTIYDSGMVSVSVLVYKGASVGDVVWKGAAVAYPANKRAEVSRDNFITNKKKNSFYENRSAEVLFGL